MRGSIVLAVAVVCAALVLSGPTDAQNIKTVEVTGTVDVGNLPLDANGNVRVAGNLRGSIEFQRVRFVTVTETNLLAGELQGPMGAHRLCAAEFPNLRACEGQEYLRTIPPEPSFSDSIGRWVVVVQVELPHYSTKCINDIGTLGSCAGHALPVACCGF